MISGGAGERLERPPLAALAILAAVLAAFIAMEFLWPRFPDIDELAFKAAGRNLAATGVFAAPELEGFLHADPPPERIYFIHPPLYSWCFGQMASLFGFGWKSCVALDAFISVLLGCVVFALAYRLSAALLIAESLRPAVAAVALIVVLLLRQVARPDELGMLLGYANVLWLLATRTRNSVASLVSGFLAGLIACTSVGVTIAFAPLIGACWLTRLRRTDWIAAVLLFAVAALAAVLLCLTPLYLREPTFYRQFFAHAQAATSISASERLSSGFALAWQVARPRFLLTVAALPLLFFGAYLSWRARPRLETVAWYIAPALGFALLLCLRPTHTYWWFLQPWFLILALIAAAQLWHRRALAGTLAATWLLVFLSASLLWPAKELLTRVFLPNVQRVDAAAQRMRDAIPPGAAVLTTVGWWALAGDRRVIDPHFSDFGDLEKIDFFVSDSNGTGTPGVWREPSNDRYKAAIAQNFEVVDDNLPRERTTVLGRAVSGSAYGFGGVVMRRIARDAPP